MFVSYFVFCNACMIYGVRGTFVIIVAKSHLNSVCKHF